MSALFPEPEPTIDEMITELEREHHMRRRVFQNWVDSGKLSAAEADRRQRRLFAALTLLRNLREEARHP
jgi:hypothetical protein